MRLEEAKKILIRAPNWVGDVIMSWPAVEAIARALPRASLSALARPAVADLYRELPAIREVLSADNPASFGGSIPRLWRGLRSLSEQIRSRQFEAAILLPNSFRAALEVWLAKVPVRIGYARDGRSFLLTEAIALPRKRQIPPHESYYYLELVRRMGLMAELAEVGEVELPLGARGIEQAGRRLAAAGLRKGSLRIAFAPGASYGSAKCWPVERYAALADGLIDAFRADVLLFGTLADRPAAEAIARLMKHRPVIFAGETNLPEFAALLRCCDLFIGNDSGAMHMAAAVGLPVVAVFGSTDPLGTGPLTRQRTIVQHKVFCSPCFLRTCPIDHRCMKRIGVDDVYQAAQIWLEERVLKEKSRGNASS